MATSHAGADVLDGPLVLRDLRPGDRATQMLESLQSNIVHPHVRNHLRLLALRIDEPAAARRGLAEIARGMKSAAEQLDELRALPRACERPERRSWRSRSAPPATHGSASTGHAGRPILRSAPACGLATSEIRTRCRWEAPYRDGIDAIVLVGSHDDALTDQQVRELRGRLGDSVRVIAEETGSTLENRNGDAIEHFGYVDGRSQPLFIDEDLAHERETTDGVDRWNPLVPLAHVLVPDPARPRLATTPTAATSSTASSSRTSAPSSGRRRALARGARAGGRAMRERMGALLVGRFEDGTPLALSATDGMGDPVPNDFTYDDDAAGARCPLSAHIRRMNPRRAEPAERTVIARRGQGYGVRNDDPERRRSREQADRRCRAALHGGRRGHRAAVRAAATGRER